jgi:hypothetical protein
MLSLIFQLRKVIAMKKYNGKELYKGLLFIKSMMDRINGLGVTIFDLGTMSARYNNYAIEC